MTKRLTYQPALDGLRAVAVIAVLIYHDHKVPGTAGGLSGGFLGVEVFFVLSGYLITSLLLSEITATGRVAFGNFFARRVRRLTPALIVMLLGVAWYTATLAESWDRSRIRSDAIATLLYSQNWHLILGHFRSGSVLNHTWSLSIEEQWYFLWPLALTGLVLLSKQRRQRVAIIVSAIALGSAAVNAWLVTRSNTTNPRMYYGTDTRSLGLLLGAAFAIWVSVYGGRLPLSDSITRFLGTAGVLIVAAMMLLAQDSDRVLFQGGLLVFGLAVIAVINATLHTAPTYIGRALSAKPLRAIGMVSYGLYLYHWPLYFVLTPAHVNISGLPLLAVRLTVTLAIATGSYFLVERPIRNASVRPRYVALAAVVAIGSTAAVVTLAAAGAAKLQYPEPASDPQPLAMLALGQVRNAAPSSAHRVLVVGDVMAVQLGSATRGRYSQGNIVATTFGSLGCGLAEGQLVGSGGTEHDELPTCSQWPDQYTAAVSTYRPKTVVLVAGSRELFNRRVNGKLLRFTTSELATQINRELERTRAIVTRDGARLVLLTVPCIPNIAIDRATPDVRVDPRRIEEYNRILGDFAAAHSATTSIADLAEVLCPPRPLDGVDWAREYWQRPGAITPAGADAVWRWIAALPEVRQ
jgi:peptidoglycan/LPS O-acetylase OafA/YrhL